MKNTFTKIRRASVILFTAAAITGCSQDGGSNGIVNPPSEPPSQPIPTVAQQIRARTGGTLSSNGYELVIPPGALLQDAMISIGSPTSLQEITQDDAQRLSLPLELNFGTSLQDTVNVRFPITSLTDAVLGIAQTSTWTSMESLYINQGKAEYHLPPNQQQDTPQSFSVKTFVVQFPHMVQAARLNTRGVDTSSTQRVALLIHGFGSSPQVFDDTLLPILNELYNNRVMIYQYPSGRAISSNVADLESRINALGSLPFTWDIVAHSMGGIVARGYTRNHPNAVDKLVTLGTPHQGIQSQLLLHSYAEAALNFHLTDTLFNPFSTGAQDIIYGSIFMNLLNAPADVNANYYLLSGDHPSLISAIIPGDDDGLVTVTSAELGNLEDRLGGGSYATAESVSSFQRHRLNIVHTDLPHAAEVTTLLRTLLASQPNNPPTSPSINPATPTQATVGDAIDVGVVSTDPETDQIAYRWVWGYADTSAWSALAPSGTETFGMHTYRDPGYYMIRAQAKDSKGALSSWSNIYGISITSEPVATTLTLQPGPEGLDTYILNSQPSSNFGNNATLYATSGYGFTFRSFMQFDVSSIPASATITSAVLYIYGSANPSYDAAVVSALKITAPWNEPTLTWNNQPALQSVYDTETIQRGASQWYPFQVTDLVREWTSGTSPNYGVSLKVYNESGNPQDASFSSSDATPPGNRPKLEIQYTLP